MIVFRDLDLREAEEALVAGCLDHPHCLLEALRELGRNPFRSQDGDLLGDIYLFLMADYMTGSFDKDERYRVAARFPDEERRWIEDELFNGNAANESYCIALVHALRATYEAQDRAVAAARALLETPIEVPVTPPPPAPTSRHGWRPQKGDHRGGITI